MHPINSSFAQLFAAHSKQHDIPSTLRLSPDLPSLDASEDPVLLSAFVSLCKLFQTFDHALSNSTPSGMVDPRTIFSAAYQQFQQLPNLSPYGNEMQRADVMVTQQWMQIVFWKFTMPYVALTTMSEDPSFSFSFPAVIARQLLSNIRDISVDTLSAHGVGMVSTVLLCATNPSLSANPQYRKTSCMRWQTLLRTSFCVSRKWRKLIAWRWAPEICCFN